MDVYFDESNSVLVPLLVERRRHHTVLYTGHPDYEIQKGDKDVEWVRVAGRRGWLVVTWGHRILRNEDEYRAVMDSGLKFIFVSNRSRYGLQLCRNLVWTLSLIPDLETMPGPQMIRVYRDRRSGRRNFGVYDREEIEKYVDRLSSRPLRSRPLKHRYCRCRRRCRCRKYRFVRRDIRQCRTSGVTNG